MKKISLIVLSLIFLTANTSFAQNKIVREGNTFSVEKPTVEKKADEKTAFTYKNNRGEVFPIYISSKGSCYIWVIDKNTRDKRKQYLGSEMSQEICKALNREYNGKPSH